MKRRMISLGLLSLMAFAGVAIEAYSQKQMQDQPIIIAASTVLDGKGRVLHNTRIVVEGGKIVRVDPKAGPVTYDRTGMTVMPGWIDAHVHITWSFGADGKNAGADAASQAAPYSQTRDVWRRKYSG